MFVEVSYDVRSAVDERWCLVLFVWSNAITAESGHGVLVYNARATLVFLFLLLVGVDGNDKRFEVTNQKERDLVLFLDGFKF